LPSDKTDVEVELEESGDLNALQQYRYYRYYHLLGPTSFDQSADFLNIETALRETFQQDITLNEKLIKAMTENGCHDHSKSRDIREKLEASNRKYWLLERDWWAYRSGFDEGPLTRGLDLWRSHPRWYMHRVLVDDCAGRGGCCSRSCGCCLHREMSLARKLGVGHCTGECGCCIKTRGFVLNTKEKKRISIRFGLCSEENDPYYRRIILASIWGLLDGSHDSPFDLIDESVRSDHVLPPMGLAYHVDPERDYLSDGDDDESTSTEILL
jgi:hypothetical protein